MSVDKEKLVQFVCNVHILYGETNAIVLFLHCCLGLLESADVSDAIAITAAIRDSQERKPIDILVCNAGVIFPGLIDEVSATELEDTVKANLLGTVYPIHAAIPLMKSCGPRTPKSIVLVSSVAGLVLNSDTLAPLNL